MRKPTKPTTVSRRRLLEPMIIGGLLILGPAACSAPGMEDAAAEVDTGGLGRDGNGKGQGPSYTPSSATPNLATSGAPSGSDPDGPAPTTSNPDPRNCTLTQGFWKNHAAAAASSGGVSSAKSAPASRASPTSGDDGALPFAQPVARDVSAPATSWHQVAVANKRCSAHRSPKSPIRCEASEPSEIFR